MYEAMKKLIEKHYYKTAGESHNKLDVFYACNRLTDKQYTELAALVEKVYTEAAEEAG